MPTWPRRCCARSGRWCRRNSRASTAPPPGRGAVVLGMGSLGAGRLTRGLGSRPDRDLRRRRGGGLRRPPPARRADLLCAADAGAGHRADRADGRGPALRGGHAAAPLGQAGAGRDLAGRPSATTSASEAWTWEHLALTRARVVAGARGAGATTWRRSGADLLAAARGRDDVLTATWPRCAARIAAAKPAEGVPGTPRSGPGRMQDVELLAQAAALLAGARRSRQAGRRRWRRPRGWRLRRRDALAAAYRLCWALQVGARLVTEEALDPGTLGRGRLRLPAAADADVGYWTRFGRNWRAQPDGGGLYRGGLPDVEETP